MTCRHAASGCNYPEGECLEVCSPSRKMGGGMAQQDGDTFTMDLLAAVAPAKRGRGLPRKENAMSDAERARRYRQRKQAAKQRLQRLKANGVTAFYRGPNGETWSGRGLMPKWLSVLVREGIDKESFRVQL